MLRINSKIQFLLNLLVVAGVISGSLSSCKQPEDDDPDVTGNENVYINEVYASGDDWIELYNANASVKDISGYKIYDDVANKYVLPNGTTIQPNGFLILNCNDLATGLNTSFKLSSTGETVYFENSGGVVIDKVIFPSLDNGQSYGRFPDGSTTLLVSGTLTKGVTNGNNSAPAIDQVTRTPLVVRPADAVVVQATLLSTTNISTVKLFYRKDGAVYSSVNMTLVGGKYEATIPAQNSNGRIDYYVEAKSTSNLTSYKPFDAPTDSYYYILSDVLEANFPKLYINEFMASNTACCPDENGEFDDWIEIYNAGDTDVDLAGMFLSDDLSNPFMDKISNNDASKTTVPAKGFLVLYADGTTAQGVNHLNFSLSGTGEEIGLFYYDGRKVDEYVFGAQTDNQSEGRATNGGTKGTKFVTPTKGTTNNP